MTLKEVIALPLIFLVTLFFCLVSCEKDSTLPVGEDWMPVNTKVYFTDSLTVKATTFKFDSIIVSDANRLLIGSYTDPIFGISKSKSYVQLSNSLYTLDRDAVYDSIALILKYDNYFYSDTIPPQKFKVYRVTEKIQYDGNSDAFYNTTNFTYDAIPLASESFKAYPKKEDSLHILLDNTFGKSIFDDIKNNDINDSEAFLYKYKGLLIEADINNTAVLGFTTNSFLRIYYSFSDEIERDDQDFEIPFNTTNSFNNISSEVQGTYFEALTNQDTYLPSYNTDNSSYIQAGTGIATRIEIPYLEKINDIQAGKGTIIDANLKLSIKQNSSTKSLFTTDSLNIYISNKNGEVISNLIDTEGETVYGRIETENLEYNIITYSIPLKYFLDLKLSYVNDDNLFLAIYSQNYNKSLERYVLNGEGVSDDLKLKLELTYAIYDK